MIVTVKKASIVAAASLIIAFAVLTASVGVTNSAGVYFCKSTRKVPVYGVDTDKKVIALTFDAAWGADKTRGIIDLLKKYDADGTFFLVGFWIDKYPEETKFIAESGLEIGNHSNNHLHMSKISKDEISKEIDSVNERIKNLTGKTPAYFRPPFGEYDNKLLSAVNEKNMVGVQWSIDSLDWKGLSGEQIAARVIPKLKNGAIILFHNNSDHVLDALKIILPRLKADGYKAVSIDELVLRENYTIDNNGIQRKK